MNARDQSERAPAGQWCWCPDVPDGQEPHDCAEAHPLRPCQADGAHVHPVLVRHGMAQYGVPAPDGQVCTCLARDYPHVHKIDPADEPGVVFSVITRPGTSIQDGLEHISRSRLDRVVSQLLPGEHLVIIRDLAVQELADLVVQKPAFVHDHQHITMSAGPHAHVHRHAESGEEAVEHSHMHEHAPVQAPVRDPRCDRCNYDTHRCPGCGEPLPHGTEVCTACQHDFPTGQKVPDEGASVLFTLTPGAMITISWSGEPRTVICDRIEDGGAVIRDLTEAEAAELAEQETRHLEENRP